MNTPEFSKTPAIGNELIHPFITDPMEFFKKNETADNTDTTLINAGGKLVDYGDNTTDTSIEFSFVDEHDKINETSKGRISSMLGKAVVPATVAAVVFQQSPLNETFRANRTFEILAETGSPLWAGVATFGWTIPIEGVAGTTISMGLLSKRDKIQPFLEKRIRKNNEVGETENRNLIDEDSQVGGVPVDEEQKTISQKASRFMVDTGITCSIGPGMVVAKRHLESSDRTFKKDMKTLLGFTALGATVSGLIGYLATGGVEHAEKVGMEAPAEWFADNAADWKFWSGLLIAGYGGKFLYGKAKQAIQKLKSA